MNRAKARSRTDERSWRSQFKSNELFSTINLVLGRFSEPYGKIFAHVDSLLSGGGADPASIPLLAETLQLLIELLYDLNCQDLAPFFEDNSALFLGSEDGSQQGFLRRYLAWERPELKGDVSDPSACGPGTGHQERIEAKANQARYKDVLEASRRESERGS